MKSLMIKDLEISKELTRDDLSAVRGGSSIFDATNAQAVTAANGGNVLGAVVAIGGSQTNTQVSVDPTTQLNFSLFGNATSSKLF